MNGFHITRQPTDTSCGPTCLYSVYRYWGDSIELDQVIEETRTLPSGGTLGVHLGCHALRRGYSVNIYTFNLQLFDPTWFYRPEIIPERLQAQKSWKASDGPLVAASDAYLEFVGLGGSVRMRDFDASLASEGLQDAQPMIAGLSSTYLYDMMREREPNDEPDDIRGVPQGHFVVFSDYDPASMTLHVADPYFSIYRGYDPCASHHHRFPLTHVVSAVMLGVLTYDANLIVVRPRWAGSTPSHS